MEERIERCLLARAVIPAVDSLEEVARRINQLMPDLPLEAEQSGRYDEVPAFVAEGADFRFVLLGVPEGEVGPYELKFRCETALPMASLLAERAGAFVNQFIHVQADSRESFLDFSEELAQALVRNGFEGCEPVRPGSA